MTPYLILLIIIVAIACAGRRYGSKGVKYLSVGIIVLFLVLFAGLRYRTVGTDTGNYLHMFESVNYINDIWQTNEYGYNAIMVLASVVSGNYATLLIFIALIVVTCYVSTIVQLTKRYETALFLFITSGAYTFFFNGARQGIAAAICFIAIPFLLDRKPTQYFLLIALAFTFHNTALIAAPLYFLAVPRVGWKQLAIVTVVTVVTIVFLAVFVQLAADLLNDRYAEYAVASEGGGKVMATFIVAQGAGLFLLRKKVVDLNGNYARLLNIYLLGIVPVIASVVSGVNPSGLLRLHPYFAYTSILLWPMFFQRIKNNNYKLILSFVFLLFFIIFYYMTTSGFSNLAPYRINKDIFL